MPRRRSLRLFRIAAVVALLAGGAVALPAAATDRVVVVQRGDTLSQIALEQGISLAQLIALNGIADPNRIYPGQRLRLAAPAAPAASTPTVASQPPIHVVRSGEHLTGIARRYGTTISAIANANAIANPSYLRVGQRLAIPTIAGGSASTAPAAAGAAAAPAMHVHTVAAGENLTVIAQRYSTTIGAIVAANAITKPSLIRPGQRLTIPGAGADAGRAAGMPASMPALVAARGGIRAIIVEEATAHGVPVAFALAVAWQESGWQPGVVSSAGAVGVMQLTPPTADWVAATMLGSRIDLFDARSNVRAGVVLLRHYLDRYHGDRSLVLAAYYQGQTAADRHGVYRITRPYIASILSLEAMFAR